MAPDSRVQGVVMKRQFGRECPCITNEKRLCAVPECFHFNKGSVPCGLCGLSGRVSHDVDAEVYKAHVRMEQESRK
jgi:hypothetical protein